MAFERARDHLEAHGLADRIREHETSSATVALAAVAAGTQPERIAKSLSFLVDGRPVLVVAAGDARIDNRAFRARFGGKPKMIPADQVEELIGHGVGGVCPFGVNDGVAVHLDESLRRFETVFPACGSANSSVELTIPELERATHDVGWVAVTKLPEPQGPDPAE